MCSSDLLINHLERARTVWSPCIIAQIDIVIIVVGKLLPDFLENGQREGIALAGRPTLVRALRVQSIGLGGDSAIHVEKGRVSCGPERSGPCMAAGGREPAVMDACNLLGRARYGDVAASKAGLLRLAASCGMPVEILAQADRDRKSVV